MRDLRNGVKLKKVQERQYNPLPIEYQLTPYEMLMDDIRSKRYTLRKVMELEDKKELSEESEDEELQLEEFPVLKKLDPKDWKNQDHYAVLGLGLVRYKATQRQIKASSTSEKLSLLGEKKKISL